MKNKKFLLLIPALAMVLGGCGKDNPDNGQQQQGTDPKQVVPATISVENVTLNKTTLAMDLGGDDVALTPTVLPADASNTKVTWESSDPSVATVSDRGSIHALKTGETTITCKTVDGGKTAMCVVTVSLPRWGDLDNPVSVATVLAQAPVDLPKAMDLSPAPIYVKGYVIKATNGLTGTNGSKYAQNIYIADAAGETDSKKQLLIYSANYNENKNIMSAYAGDQVVVSGYLQQYNSAKDATKELSECTLEMTTANSRSCIFEAITRGTSAITQVANADVTVTGLPQTAKNGSMLDFTVAPVAGKKVVDVLINGASATAGADNKYSGEVTGATKVQIITAADDQDVAKAQMAYKGSTTNMTGANDAEKVGLDPLLFSAIGSNNDSSNKPGLNAAEQIRLYNYYADPLDDAKKGNGSAIDIKGTGITIRKIYIACSQNFDKLAVKVGANVVEGADGVYEINAHEFTLKNVAEVTKSAQIYINYVKIYYTVDPHVAATQVTLNKESVSMFPYGTETLTATVAPADATDPVIWTSSDENVVKVDAGLITSVAAGTATITAKAGDVEATCAVTVNAFKSGENKTGETLKAKADIEDVVANNKDIKDFVIAGNISEITNATYGNGWMYTTDGVKVQLYGLYNFNNAFKYSQMSAKPVVGDYVVLKGNMINYNGAEIKNSLILQVNDTVCTSVAATAFALPGTAEVLVGGTYDCVKNLIRTPSDGVADITWESSDETVATVDANGVVTVVAVGNATITGKSAGLADFSIAITGKVDLSRSTADFIKSNTANLSKTGGTITGSNSVTWTMSAVPNAEASVYKNDNDFAIGSSAKPANGTVTFTTTVTQKVKEVIINGKTGSGGDTKVSVKLGETDVLAATALTTSFADYKGTVATPAAGTVVISFANVAKQFNIAKITLVFDLAE